MPLALRSPTFLPDFLFESNWTWWLVALAFAAALLFVAKSRAQKNLATAGLTLAAITLLWFLAATIFQTPAERLYAVHAQLARAAEQQNTAAIAQTLAPTFRCPALDVAEGTPINPILDQLLKSAGITSVSITHYAVTLHAPQATTTITVFAQVASKDYFKSTWDLEWTDDPASDWKITRADLRSVNDQPLRPDQVISKLAQ